MRTVIMSFVREMEYGEQTLPTNDLFVYLPVQILPDLVTAMEQQGFKPAEVKGGSGNRPKEEGTEDNPLIVVGVHTKDRQSFLRGTFNPTRRSGNWHPTYRNCGLAELPAITDCQASNFGCQSGGRDFHGVLCAASGRCTRVCPLWTKGVC